MYASKQVFPSEELKGRRLTTAARIESEFRRLLAERGFHQISVADIADACGIARSTFYRLFADPIEVLWAIARPHFDAALDSALKGDAQAFAQGFGALWTVPGLAAGLAHAKAAPDIRAKLETLVTARLRQRIGGRNTDTCALVMVAAMLAVIGRGVAAPTDAELSEVMSLIYIAAYLTPAALQSMAREQARHAISGRFPPAVSVEESLASDDYIVSMIDGRRYRSLTRHIARYGMTPADYRSCFGLDDDYPMVAAAYSERRRALAISAGFGTRRGQNGHAAAA
ncbi:TetR family transcriptional regulator [Sphingomonas sp. ID1715]|uniref:MucR family transcriptional regulator n=1 Tax=Sphingomonas sp. ID1715 TaxID=1656898 RepID=UPI001489898D|nr:MucR family transcriptional regulator [Sphingomonas sp. ID1715]NNM76240.1 TetR family transcriptional regulator [Sphingomonas sp. ID1715]